VAVRLTIVKKFTYRGADEEFSNTYHFTGANPADTAAWDALSTSIRTQERTVYTPAVKIQRVYGYNSGADSAVYVQHWELDTTNTPGTLAAGTSIPAPGDAAVWLRQPLAILNSKGKRIFLRKYFHDARLNAAGGDTVFAAQKTALVAFGAFLRGSTIPDTRRVCDKNGNVPTGDAASDFITTRTLKRRGKRPPTSP
jgi:hypothetical protein